MPFFTRFLTSLLCCLLPLATPAQTPSPNTPEAAAAMNKMMAFAQENQCFNGVLLVADKGKIIYNKGFGYANTETWTPNTETTRFNLCSITKQFTAMGIMMLREAGKLDYDDELSAYFPQLSCKGVTLRHLLHHTSGLPDYMPLLLEHWTDNRMPNNADAIAMLEEYKPPVKFQPGERHEYSNTGYMLLASVIEKVSGISYEKFMQQRIFEPLGMKHTQVYLPATHEKPAALAEPYAFDYATGAFVPTRQYPPYARQVGVLEGCYGDGGIFSCSSDLFLWDQALKTEKLIKKKTLDEAFTNGRLADGNPIGPTGYGFGWFLTNDPSNGRVAHHTGGWPGCRQAIIRYLDKDRTLIVLRNNEIAFSSIQKAVDGILDGKPWDMPKTSLTYVLAASARNNEAADLRKKFEAARKNTAANEMEINDLGYKLMEQGKLKHALEIMKINVELFPASSNAYDSLGEMYLKNGDKEQSELNYKKSKELLPRNEASTEGLAAYAPAPGRLLVANKTANTLSVIQLADYRVLAEIPVGAGPHEVAVNPSGGVAAVANYGDQRIVGNSLSIIDIAALKKVKDIDLGEYRRPHGMEFINENEVLVTCEQKQVLLKVDIRSGSVSEVARTNQAGSHMVAYSPADQKAYVANVFSGTVSVIDVAANQLLRQIELRQGIEGLAVSPDGQELWVANRDDSTVTAINTQSFENLAVMPAHQVAYRIKFLPNGQYVMVSNGLSGNLSVYDAKQKKHLLDVDLTTAPGTQAVPVGIAAHANSAWVYVSASGYNQVAVIHTGYWKVAGRLNVGEGPDGIYVANAALDPLDELVDAEKAFANYAKEHSTKEAFLRFLSDDGLIFRANAVNGKAFWSEAPQDSDWLKWYPLYADIATSGDLGYTTGPYEYYGNRNDAKAVGYGHYFSIWKKQKNGDWKVALDIGISHPPTPVVTLPTSAIRPPVPSAPVDLKLAKESLLQAERAFIQTQQTRGLKAYDSVLSAEGRICRPGTAPYATPEAREEFLASTDKKFSYVPLDADVSESGDLGYVYGTGAVDITRDGNTRTLPAHYVRMWKKEDGKNWKIVLDLVSLAR